MTQATLETSGTLKVVVEDQKGKKVQVTGSKLPDWRRGLAPSSKILTMHQEDTTPMETTVITGGTPLTSPIAPILIPKCCVNYLKQIRNQATLETTIRRLTTGGSTLTNTLLTNSTPKDVSSSAVKEPIIASGGETTVVGEREEDVTMAVS